MTAASENGAPQTVTTAVWIGFATMCLGMFMAILDVPDCYLAADHPAGAEHRSGSNELDPNRIFDR